MANLQPKRLKLMMTTIPNKKNSKVQNVYFQICKIHLMVSKDHRPYNFLSEGLVVTLTDQFYK